MTANTTDINIAPTVAAITRKNMEVMAASFVCGLCMGSNPH